MSTNPCSSLDSDEKNDMSTNSSSSLGSHEKNDMSTNSSSLLGSHEKSELKLPLGYRFDPTDLELLEHYLVPKLKGEALPSEYIKDLDVYQYEPPQLPLNEFKHARENEAYFFTEKRKNPRGQGYVRATPNGFWRVYRENAPINRANEIIGYKTKLFYHSNGIKTQWQMIEYKTHANHIPTTTTNMKNYIICRVNLMNKLECLGEELSDEGSGTSGGKS